MLIHESDLSATPRHLDRRTIPVESIWFSQLKAYLLPDERWIKPESGGLVLWTLDRELVFVRDTTAFRSQVSEE